MLRRLLYFFELTLVAINFVLVHQVFTHYSFNFFKNQQFVQGLAPLREYAKVFWIALIIWAILLWAQSGYRHLRFQTLGTAFRCLVVDGVIFLAFFTSLAFLLRYEFISRFFILVYAGSTTFLLIVCRWCVLLMARTARKKGHNLRNIILVGTGRRAQQFLSLLAKHREWGYRVLGLLDHDPEMIDDEIAGYQVIGLVKDLPDLLEKQAVDEVFFVTPRKWLEEISKYIAYCEAIGVPATVSTDLFDVEIASRVPKALEGMTYLTFETRLLKEGELVLKRIFDIMIAGFAILLSFPIFLLAAISVKISSKGPIFFKQRRCGRNGRTFMLYKFRSMIVDAEAHLADLQNKNEMSGPVFKITHDPRVTSVGRFLRKTSIDELPQLWNVLKGDMSIVGPRPPLPSEVHQYEPWQRRRLSMNPGITCIWQVSGRNSIAFEEWMRLDLRYIDNWSLWLDLKIIFQTAHAVFSANGK